MAITIRFRLSGKDLMAEPTAILYESLDFNPKGAVPIPPNG